MANIQLPGKGFQNPTLVPNFDKNVAISGIMTQQSPASFIALFTRANATETITLGGTVTDGDEITITIACGVLPDPYSVSVVVTAGSADTLETLAEAIATAINQDATLQAFGVYADNAIDVVTVTWPGPVGNFAVVTDSVSGSATETVTLGNSGKLAGGGGPVIPFADFSFSLAAASFVKAFMIGKPETVDYRMLNALVQQHKPIS